jgi:hypothetical protein
MGLGMIRRGNELYQYYAGGAGDHGGGARGGSAIFRAVQRLDGFVSASAGASAGELVTSPLRFSGRRLFLNVDTSASGVARVEVVNAAGFELGNCRPMIANHVAQEVSWGNADLSRLAPGPVSLRFELKNAHLFAFQFGDAAG